MSLLFSAGRSAAQDAPVEAAAEVEAAQADTVAEERIEPDAPDEKPGEVDTIVVTGEKQAADVTGGTKSTADTRDLPISVQVIPRELLDNQIVFRPSDIIQNVSGVYRGNPNFGDNFIFRGFVSSSEYLRDGLPDRRETARETANVEQLEVLKGPASVLFGRAEPGGTINYVTKKPLSGSRNGISVQADEFGLFRYTTDLATQNATGTFGVRFNGASEDGESFRDFSFSERRFGSLSTLWKISEATTLAVELEALDDNRQFDRGIVNIGDRPADVPVSRFIGEPTDFRNVTERLGGYTIDHRLNAQWRVRHALRYTDLKDNDARTQAVAPFPASGIIQRDFRSRDSGEELLSAQLELYGNFELLGLPNQFLVGVDRDEQETDFDFTQFNERPASNSINIFAPVYGRFVRAGGPTGEFTRRTITQLDTSALYAQSLVDLLPSVKLLLGVRYDDTDNRTRTIGSGTPSKTTPSATSPRLGVVVQPLEGTSLFVSYSEAFTPITGATFAGDSFEPLLSDQIEVGIKQDLFDNSILATLAAYRIVRENILTTDPVNTGFSIQTGEVESEGVELDLSGSPLPGLSVSLNASYNEARVTKDTRLERIGRPLPNVPDFGAGGSISYEPQNEAWRGYGAGLRIRHVAERQGAATESYVLPSYTRADASIWWRNTHWHLALKADNVLDKRYFESAQEALGTFPGTPRAFSAKVSYDF